MSDVTVHHCTLRIVRHGGWEWAPEPRKLLQSAIKALPEILAHALGELWPDDVEREFAAPISIRVPLSMSELLAAVNEGSEPDSIPNSPTMQALGERIGSAARTAFVTEQTTSVTDLEDGTRPHVDARLNIAAESGTGSAILDALLLWHKDGVLHRRLAAFSQTAREAWLDRLSRMKSDQPGKESVALETIERFVSESALSLLGAPGDRAATLLRRLIVLTEVMAQLGLRECSPALLTALDRAFPLAERGEAGVANLDGLRLRGDKVDGVSATYAPEHAARATSAEQAIHERDRGDEAKLSGFNRSGASGDREQRALPHATRMSEQATSESSHRGEAEFTGFDNLRAGGQAESGSLSNATGKAESPSVHTAQSWPQQAEHSSTSFSSAATESTLSSPRRSPPTETSLPLLWRQAESAARQFPLQGKTRRIASALPFLLLGPLSRVGYLKALAATMEAANALEATPLFAAALAYKVLAPVARGWRREPDSIEAASTFAALNQPAPGNALVELARILPDYLSPLDAVLSGALISGHKREQPLLLLRIGLNASSGFLLLDVEGTFPIQWAASADGLRQVLIQLDSSIVLIPQDSAEIELLRWMDDEGFRFVTDALPTRGEHWRALRRSPQERWWTNETIMSESALARTARVMRDSAEEAATLWQALAVERPGAPLADNAGLDHHLALAASTALGTIAWELWREREPTTPLLALERFRDLEARVSFSSDVVSVHLPLGKRFNDLRDHGLIEDVNDVPWFNGRRLTFTAG